jgi:hypothetical protein
MAEKKWYAYKEGNPCWGPSCGNKGFVQLTDEQVSKFNEAIEVIHEIYEDVDFEKGWVDNEWVVDFWLQGPWDTLEEAIANSDKYWY